MSAVAAENVLSDLIQVLKNEQRSPGPALDPASLDELLRLLLARKGQADEQAADAETESTLIGALPDAAGIFGSQGRLVLSNRTLDALAAGGKATGMTALELTRSSQLAEAVKAALRGEARRFELALPARQRTMLVHLAPLQSQRALLVLRDLTESKLMEAARRDFVANASHELRTPVTAIAGSAETLLTGAVDDPVAARRFVEMIARHADRLSRLTQDLLDLSRIETGERGVDIQPLELCGFAKDVLEFFSPRAEERSIDLRNEVSPDIVVLADKQALEQSVVNLVDNALKFTPPNGRITLRASTGGNTALISVLDTGPGIERHHLPRIFERFYRADPGRARAAGGDGLGLAIVKHLVQAQGGEVGVESDRNGTRFWIRLPLAEKGKAQGAR